MAVWLGQVMDGKFTSDPPASTAACEAKAAQVRQTVRVAGQAVLELCLVQAVHEEHVQARRGGHRVVEDLVQRSPVLPREMDVARRLATGADALDRGEAQCGQTGGGDVDGSGGDLVLTSAYAAPAEPQWRAGLAHVQRAVGAGLVARAPVAWRHRDVGCVR